jgi:hypothetical protein
MPKSKHGPALFEVFDKGTMGEAGPRPPGWQPKARKSVVKESASAFKTTLSSLARSLGGSSDDPEEAAPPTAGVKPPMVAIDGGLIRIALTSRGAGVAVFALLLAACVVFATGQWVGRQAGFADGEQHGRLSVQRAAQDEIARARESEPVRDLFEGVGETPVSEGAATLAATPLESVRAEAPAAGRAREPVWVNGNTYVVVQSFRGSARDDAVQAREYLAQHGIESEIIGRSSTGYRLIATKGFNRSDATQRKLADHFLERIRSIGKAYFDAGGRYKLEGYFATLKSDSW